MAMTGSSGLNLAEPGVTLLKLDEPSQLAFETTSWLHLNRYMSRVESVPAEFASGSAVTGEALDKVRSEARGFGSPRRLRQLVAERPNALADAQPPPMLYAGIVWLVQHLHESAAAVVSFLQSLRESAESSTDVKEGLRLLGSKAQNARTPISSLSNALKTFKARLLTANSGLSDACKAEAQVLHQLQEAVGGLQVRVESLQEQINQLGFFSSKKTRTDLTQQLESLQQELTESSARAEKLRAALGALEPLLDEGYWLEAGVDDFVSFLNEVRKVWTSFGSGVTQLAADASAAQLADAAWLEKVLGLEEAIKQWQAIDQAAKHFVVESLVDLPSD